MPRLIRSLAARSLPEAVKRKIRPLYNTLFQNRRAAGRVAIMNAGGYEVAFRPGTVDEAVIGHSFANDIFFSGVPEYVPNDDDVIIDVGSHIGTFALLAASKVPRGRVYAIEACKESFDLLRINIALNRVDTIDAEHIALSDNDGQTFLFHTDDNWGHSIVAQNGSHGESVACEALSSFVQRRGIERCAFMKMNCEGAEFRIILGASMEVLSRFDTILVLYHCDLAGNCSERALLEHLNSAGFATSIRERTEQRGWIIARNSGRHALGH